MEFGNQLPVFPFLYITYPSVFPIKTIFDIHQTHHKSFTQLPLGISKYYILLKSNSMSVSGLRTDPRSVTFLSSVSSKETNSFDAWK